MASPCLCKPPTASEPASRVKPILKQTFGRASREAAREALPRVVPNGAFDCSIISGHSSRKIFCGYKLNTLLRLRTFCCELSSTQECSEDRDPGGTTRPAGLLRHSSRLPCTPRLTAGLLPGLPRFSGRCPRPRLPVAPVTACVFLLKRKAIDALLDK